MHVADRAGLLRGVRAAERYFGRKIIAGQ
jgi:hypothetical protein